MVRYLLLIINILFPLSLFAQTDTPSGDHKLIHGVLNTAITYGGDDLIKLSFQNASDEKIKAGNLLMLGGGVLITPENTALSIQLTANYFFDSVEAKNGDASFERYPIELLFFNNFGKHRVGAGATLHLSPKADINIDNTPHQSVDFDDATGIVAEYDYLVSDEIRLGVRYTSIDYSADGIDDIDGDNIGLTALFQF